MDTTFDALTREAFVLPADQRIALAHQLLSSVDPDPDPEAEARWEQEIARRIACAAADETAIVPAAEVYARLQRIAPGQS